MQKSVLTALQGEDLNTSHIRKDEKENAMKKALTLLTVGIIATAAMAQEPQAQADDIIMPPLPPPEKPRLTVFPASPEAHIRIQERRRQQRQERENKIREAMIAGITDDEQLKTSIRLIFEFSSPAAEFIAEPVGFTRWAEKEFNVPRERLTKVLENMIRENLSSVKEDGVSVSELRLTNHLMILLGTFPNYDIAPLAKEVFQSKDMNIHYGAMVAYLNLEGTKAIPFLQETIKQKRYTPAQHNQLSEHLQRVTAKLNAENKTADEEKLNAFIKEMKQAEQLKKTQ